MLVEQPKNVKPDSLELVPEPGHARRIMLFPLGRVVVTRDAETMATSDLMIAVEPAPDGWWLAMVPRRAEAIIPPRPLSVEEVVSVYRWLLDDSYHEAIRRAHDAGELVVVDRPAAPHAEYPYGAAQPIQRYVPTPYTQTMGDVSRRFLRSISGGAS